MGHAPGFNRVYGIRAAHTVLPKSQIQGIGRHAGERRDVFYGEVPLPVLKAIFQHGFGVSAVERRKRIGWDGLRSKERKSSSEDLSVICQGPQRWQAVGPIPGIIDMNYGAAPELTRTEFTRIYLVVSARPADAVAAEEIVHRNQNFMGCGLRFHRCVLVCPAMSLNWRDVGESTRLEPGSPMLFLEPFSLGAFSRATTNGKYNKFLDRAL